MRVRDMRGHVPAGYDDFLEAEYQRRYDDGEAYRASLPDEQAAPDQAAVLAALNSRRGQ